MSTKIPLIDVSYAQGAIDWTAVKKSGVNAAIIRVGYCKNDGSWKEGFGNGVDTHFKCNIEGATAAGLDVGIYAFTNALSEESARKFANGVLDIIKHYKLTYPVVLDIEDTDTKYTKYSRDFNTKICKAFLEVIEKAGYYAMLYTHKYFAEDHLHMEQLGSYDFWLAQYNTIPTYKGDFGIWQYSEKGKVSGISGNVDFNYSYRDYPALIRAGGLNHLGTKPNPDPPTGELVPEEELLAEVARRKKQRQSVTRLYPT